MKRQKKKQDRLVLKLLPKEVVTKLNDGLNTAEEFDSATMYFSCVVEFYKVTRKCTAIQVVNFLNNLYQTMDDRMDNYDVYKVETISDSYLVASGIPVRNGDK
jgi:class 3 adenylate cyclase